MVDKLAKPASVGGYQFGSYRREHGPLPRLYRCRRTAPRFFNLGTEPDLLLLKQVEQVTTLVVEGPAGQDSEHGVAVLVFIQQLLVWLLFRCRNSQEGPRASVCDGRSGSAAGLTRRFQRTGPLGFRASCSPNQVRQLHNSVLLPKPDLFDIGVR